MNTEQILDSIDVNGKKYKFLGVLKDGTVIPEMLSKEVLDLLGNKEINNLVDGEDLQSVPLANGISVIKLKDRIYGFEDDGGMGYVILRKNKTFAEQVIFGNTIYEIRYDFDLNGSEVSIPQNSILRFNGGCLKNGILTGRNTMIEGIPSFHDITPDGTYNSEFKISWFESGEYSKIIENLSKTSSILYIDKDVRCEYGIKLYCNVNGNGVLQFVSNAIDYAVEAIGEFDIDKLNIDCTNVNVCKCGFFSEKSWNTTRHINHNIYVKHVHSKNKDVDSHGIIYVQHSNTNTNGYDLGLKCDIEDIYATPNGAIGDPAGSATGLSISLLNENVGTHNISVFDSSIKNVYDIPFTAEDTACVHIINYNNDNVIRLYNNNFTLGTKRILKLQGYGVDVYNCIFNADGTVNGEELVSSIGIDVMSVNTTIRNCKIYSNGVLFPYCVQASASCENLTFCDSEIYSKNGYNLINISGAKNTKITNVSLTSEREYDGEVAKSAITISSAENCDIDIYASVPNIPLAITAYTSESGRTSIKANGKCRNALICSSGTKNVSVHDSNVECSEYFVYLRPGQTINLSGISINNNVVRAKGLVWLQNILDLEVNHNTALCTSNETNACIVFVGCENANVRYNDIVSTAERSVIHISGASGTRNNSATIIYNTFTTSLENGDVLKCTYQNDIKVINNVFKAKGIIKLTTGAEAVKINNINMDSGVLIQ